MALPDPVWAESQVRAVATARAWSADQLSAALNHLATLGPSWSAGSAAAWFEAAARALGPMPAVGADKLGKLMVQAANQHHAAAGTGSDQAVIWNTVVASAQDARSVATVAGGAASNIAKAAADTAGAIGDVAKANPGGLLAVAAIIAVFLLTRK